MILLRLFYEFFKTGLFAIGGGMATLPFLSKMADKTGWFTQAQLSNMIAIAESTPGPIGVNTATYVGYTTAGIPGAIVATIGLIAPSILVILIVARFLKSFKDNRWVSSAFYGLRPTSMALIASAGLLMIPAAFLTAGEWVPLRDLFSNIRWGAVLLGIVIFLASSVCPRTKRWHPLVWILLSAAVGIVFRF